MTQGEGRKEKRSSTHGAGLIRCPFFREHSTTEIRCEGVAEGVTTGMVFWEKKYKDRWQDIYCRGRYEACEICRMLMREKYDD